ncbi:hypothetical protein GCM10023144_18530 [Pigmentiphaga soli]|uniref:Lipoprotein n=1 Tax=Pigmentiphaga soli TaxID=1007095 RepID=A0ABP8GW08_9BURK
MQKQSHVLFRIGKPLLGAGLVSLALLLGGCGGDDDPAGPGPGDNGGQTGDGPPPACTTAHCAPTP